MADDKKPQPAAQDKPEPKADDKKPQARAAAPEAPPEKPNLTQQQVEGFIQNQLCQKGMASDQAAAEAKKRASTMVR